MGSTAARVLRLDSCGFQGNIERFNSEMMEFNKPSQNSKFASYCCQTGGCCWRRWWWWLCCPSSACPFVSQSVSIEVSPFLFGFLRFLSFYKNERKHDTKKNKFTCLTIHAGCQKTPRSCHHEKETPQQDLATWRRGAKKQQEGKKWKTTANSMSSPPSLLRPSILSFT